MRHVLLVLSLSLLAACTISAPPPPYPTVAGDPAEYAPFLEEGTGVVSGQAFMKTRGGDVKLGAGNTVTLDPITA